MDALKTLERPPILRAAKHPLLPGRSTEDFRTIRTCAEGDGSRGPAFLIHEKDRVRYVADRNSKVKVLSGNRYEHFEPTDETVVEDDRGLQVFA
ncbi:DUF5988 family protein [Streptomyces sp. NPDC002559]